VISKKSKIESEIITNIKSKMIANQFIIAKADKEKTITILTQDEYKLLYKKIILQQLITIQPNITKKK
jgi:hypothetical protein